MMMRLVTPLACALVLSACGGAVAATDATTQTQSCILLGVRVSPSAATLHAGDTLRAHAVPGACSTGVVSFLWSTSDSAVAAVESSSGLIHGISKGLTTVIARDAHDTTDKGAMVVQVVP
ncbi:MAG: Ig-like domain-containing protein [Gemmatimonadaceae bacterium]